MASRIIIHNGYVKIHYQHKKRIRISTGIKIPIDTIKNNPYISKDRRLTSRVTDYKNKQKTIDDFKKKIDDIIRDYIHKHNISPTGPEVKYIYESYKDALQVTDYLVETYNNYFIEKENEFSTRNDKSYDSIKDYRGLLYYLEDYETYLNKKIKLKDVNEKWLSNLVSFLQSERDRKDWKGRGKNKNNEGKYHVLGGLKGITISKKINLLSSFYTYLDEENEFEYPSGLKGFSTKIDKGDTVKATLTKEEIHLLYQFTLNNEGEQFVRDVFIFSCLTGLRWGDLTTIHKRLIKKEKDGYLLEKKAMKTKDWFRVWLNSIAMEVVERYDYDFTKYTNANFNKKLKIILKNTELFNEETPFVDKHDTPLKRYQCISVHRGRDTFCTLLVQERVPLNEIVKYTGHKSIATLNKYVDKVIKPKNYTNELIYKP